MRIEDLDYDLPPDRIATTPAEPRDHARLMVVDRADGSVRHCKVADLPELSVFEAGDLMLVNCSRVVPAYYQARRASTGGRLRGLYLGQDASGRWRTMLESRGRLKAGETIVLDRDAGLKLIEPLGGGEWLAAYEGARDPLTLLKRIGAPPLPPYIRRARKAQHQPEITPDDIQRYNTVYADRDGSVAAPTAGLHFTPELLCALDQRGVIRHEVVLHVGLGTFAPIRTDTVEDHPIHSEPIVVPPETVRAIRQARAAGRTITAVGTTTVRAIESLPEPLDLAAETGHQAETDLYITPDNGFRFRFTDRLMTNFHLPRSTLLAMVAALPGVGIQRLLAWYRIAIDEGYRFYSYGDAMLIL